MSEHRQKQTESQAPQSIDTSEFRHPGQLLKQIRRSIGLAAVVLACGGITSSLALLGVYLLNEYANVNIMGVYVYFLFPVGAIPVGLVASSGYAAAAWILGVRMRWLLFVPIVFLQVGSYFAAQYIEYSATGPHTLHNGHVLNFKEYFDKTTRAFAFENKKSGLAPEPVGPVGYVLRVAEIIGFVSGTLIILRKMSTLPHCRYCQRYLKVQDVAVVPPQSAIEQPLMEAFQNGDQSTFLDIVEQHKTATKYNNRLHQRIAVVVGRCKSCDFGLLKIVFRTGQWSEEQTTVLFQADAQRAFIRSLADAKLI